MFNLRMTFLIILGILLSQNNLSANFRISNVKHTNEYDCTGSFELTLDGNYQNYEIEWTGPEGFKPPTPESRTTKLSNLCEGYYSFKIVSDFNRCIKGNGPVLCNDCGDIIFSTVTLPRTSSTGSVYIGTDEQINETYAKVADACGEFVNKQYFYKEKGSIELYGYNNLVDDSDNKISYIWENGAETDKLEELRVGQYCVEIVLSTKNDVAVVDAKCFQIGLINDCGVLKNAGKDNETSITKIEELDIQYFPNPFADYLEVSMNSVTNDALVELHITGSDGSLLVQEKITDYDQTNIKLDTSHLPAGIYFLVAKTGQEEKTFKILKH